MKRGRIVLAVAMAIYVASFFASAVGRVMAGESHLSIVGYKCAYMTLLCPWTHDAFRSFPENHYATLSPWCSADGSILLFLVAIGFLAEEKDHQRNHDGPDAYGALADDPGMLDRFLSRKHCDAWPRVLSLDWRHGGSDILSVVGARESSAGIEQGFLSLMSKTRNHGRSALEQSRKIFPCD